MKFGAGLKFLVRGNTWSLAMESVIVFAVIEFLMNAVAYFETLAGGHNDVPSVKEFMDISSKKDTVFEPVLSFPLIISRA